MYELVFDHDYLQKTAGALNPIHRALRESADLTIAIWHSLENSYTLTGEMSEELMVLMSASIKATLKLVAAASLTQHPSTLEDIPF